MADINKSGLLILDESSSHFLVTRKNDANVPHWILPGGRIEEGESPEVALVREIKEELGCDLDQNSLEFVGEYEAPAAGRPGQFVNIKLYRGIFTGEQQASSEIRELGWLSKEDAADPLVSETISQKIIPDLVGRGILN